MNKIPLTCLVILDGFGYNKETTGNAILSTPTPNLDNLWQNYPHTLLKAAEEEVGLNFGEMGNSEVGHLILGSGRVIYQSIQRINASLEDGSFYKNKAFLEAIDHVKKHHSSLHIMGMVSVAGVHAHLDHFIRLIELASKSGVKTVYLHPILDGRDSGPKDAPLFLEKLIEAIKQYKTGSVASLHGRAYAMDRNQNWERTVLSYYALLGQNSPTGLDALQIINDNYSKGSDDENLLPTTIVDSNNQPIGPIKENDALIFTNFREDRARQIIRLLTGKHQVPQVPPPPKNFKVVTMTQYDSTIPTLVAFPPQHPVNTLSDHLSSLNIHQTHISETEKYAHVTYFLNGGREEPHPNEVFINVPSPKPETFETNPEMAAAQITQKVLETIAGNPYEFIIVNFANPDMIAHTGNFEATRKAISIIDQYIGQISQAVFAQNGFLFLTADHGNCESMVDPATGNPTKDHTSSPVPFIAASPSLKITNPTQDRVTANAPITGILADVAPSILNLIGITPPVEMTGTPLFSTPA